VKLETTPAVALVILAQQVPATAVQVSAVVLKVQGALKPAEFPKVASRSL